MNRVIGFNTHESIELAEVGGKGLSLIRMTKAALPVPPGIILSVDFFAPWYQALEKSAAWKKLENITEEEVKNVSQALKSLAEKLILDQSMREQITEGLRAAGIDHRLWAVRSSSPEEDLENASFAGGYETLLGVDEETLEDAIRSCFISSLDSRIISYKKVHGFSTDKPTIAVVIQEMVDCEKAGVAFTINPLSNSYDEVVINANFGLGETVVSGTVSPDFYCYDTAQDRELERKIGKREFSLKLNPKGGLEKLKNPGSSEACLSKEEVRDIARMSRKVVGFFNKPMDIEWGMAGGKIFLLQARPITTYFRIPEPMLTRPDQAPKLYMDFTLIGQGIHSPMSVMGQEVFSRMQEDSMNATFGRRVMGLEDGLFFAQDGRDFFNISNFLKIPGGKAMLPALCRFDPLSLKILRSLKKGEYVSQNTPKPLKGFVFGIIKVLMNFRKMMKNIIADPENYKKSLLENQSHMYSEIDRLFTTINRLSELTDKLNALTTNFIRTRSLAVTFTASSALGAIKRLFKHPDEKTKALLKNLEKGLPENITITMGLELYRLSQFSELEKYKGPEKLLEAITAKELSPEFMKAWNHYLDNFGIRCPKELDVGTARSYENPQEICRQLINMKIKGEPGMDAQSIFDRAWEEREKSFQALKQKLTSPRKREQLNKNYKIWVMFGGYRELHKYYVIRAIDRIRKKALEKGRNLAATGVISRPTDIFSLTLKQADQLSPDSPPAHVMIKKNTYFRETFWKNQRFPCFFNSRGKILHPPTSKIKENQIMGESISPGSTCGKVKVLHEPDEKPLLPGEILVARATDPGWTPLFVNAGGVILEVGGVSQHGAVVAREYGKPCIAGIEKATELFIEGETIEMNGTTGIITFLNRKLES